MNVNYYLSPSGTIMVSFTFGRSRLRVSTGDKIKSDYWSQENQRAVTSSQYDGSELNFKLKQLEAWFYNEHRKQTNNGIQVSSDSIRAAFLDHMNRTPKQVIPTGLISFIPEFLKTAKNKKGQPYSVSTRLLYELLERQLRDFQSETGFRVDFDTVGRVFYDKFTDFLRTRVNKDSSVGAYIRPLKHVLNVAFNLGISQCIEQKKDYFVSFKEDSDQEALSASEITAIYNLKLDDPYLGYIRDLFVLACHTGLRYSDWINYKPENVIENGTVLRAFTRKTRETVYIPLHPRAKVLLDRVFKSPFPMPINPEFDRMIKRVIKTESVKGKRTKTYTFNGASKSVVVNRCDMISAHTARRSFATNASRSGISNDAIMRMTAHKTERIFKQYVRIEKLESAKAAASNRFFNE